MTFASPPVYISSTAALRIFTMPSLHLFSGAAGFDDCISSMQYIWHTNEFASVYYGYRICHTKIHVSSLHYGGKIYYRSYASGSGDVELYIGEVTVELGSAENVSGKVGELANILPELTGLSGTLYLDTYNEADSTPTYTFKKSSEQTEN